jgi:hypothetical protein
MPAAIAESHIYMRPGHLGPIFQFRFDEHKYM